MSVHPAQNGPGICLRRECPRTRSMTRYTAKVAMPTSAAMDKAEYDILAFVSGLNCPAPLLCELEDGAGSGVWEKVKEKTREGV